MRLSQSAIVTVICVALAATSPAAGKDTQPRSYAVGPQYGATHVYVAPVDFDRFVASFIATFGGKTSPKGVSQITPTPSRTTFQAVFTPVGTLSVFGFTTPVPYPFGAERTGYLVNDMDGAVAAASRAGADVIVQTFPDPIGRDAVIGWPGGVNMQIYWHVKAPHYAALQTIPENRVYVSPQRADAFVSDFVSFSRGKVVSDDPKAPGLEIGRPGYSFRRIRIESGFGRIAVYATDGHLPYPFGREMTGYEVSNLDVTLNRAKAAGVTVLVEPFVSENRRAAFVQFPGGYIAEFHTSESH